MILSQAYIKNFKCFSELSIEHFHPQMNILLGNNGTGKSSILEALRVLLGSLYLNFDKYDNRITSYGITNEEVRLSWAGTGLEPQIPCILKAEATVSSQTSDADNTEIQQTISWQRSVEKRGGKTLHKEAKEMKEYSQQLQTAVREGTSRQLPLIAYFSTNRYKKERRDTDIHPTGSRLQGYFNALDTNTSIKFFLDLFKTETYDELQKGRPSVLLQVVNETIRTCNPNFNDLIYYLKEDELIVTYQIEEGSDNVNDQMLPFSLLSDGIRSTLALVMELAFRCYLLNPHLGVTAPQTTPGVVLIDEVDLHLHPSWQTHILNDLRRAFPHIQFIVTTHAPLVISQIGDCSIFSLSEQQIYDFPSQNGRDANYILQEMEVTPMATTTQNMLNKYIALIDNGQGLSEEALNTRQSLEKVLGKNHAELQRADMLLSFF